MYSQTEWCVPKWSRSYAPVLCERDRLSVSDSLDLILPWCGKWYKRTVIHLHDGDSGIVPDRRVCRQISHRFILVAQAPIFKCKSVVNANSIEKGNVSHRSNRAPLCAVMPLQTLSMRWNERNWLILVARSLERKKAQKRADINRQTKCGQSFQTSNWTFYLQRHSGRGSYVIFNFEKWGNCPVNRSMGRNFHC